MRSRRASRTWFPGSPPDDALYAAAASDALSTPEERVEHVRRLAGTAAARATSLRYLGDWVHIDRLDNLGDTLGDDLRGETEAFFEYLVWDEARPLTELLNANYTIISEELAAAYGLEAPGPDGRLDLTNVPRTGGHVDPRRGSLLGGWQRVDRPARAVRTSRSDLR